MLVLCVQNGGGGEEFESPAQRWQRESERGQSRSPGFAGHAPTAAEGAQPPAPPPPGPQAAPSQWRFRFVLPGAHAQSPPPRPARRRSGSRVPPVCPSLRVPRSPRHVRLRKVRLRSCASEEEPAGAVPAPLRPRAEHPRGAGGTGAGGRPPAHPDQRDPQGHRHRRQVHRRRRCHRGGGRLWRWHRHRLREPHHRLRQEPLAETAAFLLCHLGLCPLRGHGAVLPHGGLPHPLRHVTEPVTVTVTEPAPPRPVPCPAENPG
ncbi:ATP synthase F(0) complex subunit C2, mitochondrial isoform X1 [Patagioenas fasciata]|uniref:ATP synthase F(0) complex subunit C2, mitochondrial isoform X1 n=1 Tax=Patagioenas fasciata TaxID=372321 RepID=UPI003A98E821